MSETSKESTAKADQELNADKFAQGRISLRTPIRAAGKDVTELAFDFGKLTGWDYVDAMDSDKQARNVFQVTQKQALCLFAKAAAKSTPDVDEIDIRERIGMTDAMRGVQAATLFLFEAAREQRTSFSAL